LRTLKIVGFTLFVLIMWWSSAAGVAAPASPKLCSAKLLKSDGDSLLIEFQSAKPVWGRQQLNGEWYDTIDLPGCENADTPGEPRLPFLGFLVAIPEPSEPTVEVESVDSVTFTGLKIAPACEPLLVQSGNGFEIQHKFALDTNLYRTNSLFPATIVKAEYAGIIRGQPVARIRVFPARFNPVAGSLNLVRAARFRVKLPRPAGPDKTQTGVKSLGTGTSLRMLRMVKNCVLNPDDVRPLAINRDGGKSRAPTFPLQEPPAFKIRISQDGIYRLTGEQLVAAGLDLSTLDPTRIAITNRGEYVPIEVHDGGDSKFDDEDFVLFWAQAPRSDFTNENVYWLLLDDEQAARMSVADASPHGAPALETFVNTLRLEEDKVYWQNIPYGAGEDHWFWTKTTASDTTIFPFEIDNLADRDFDASIVIQMWGKTGIDDVNPDHHTRVYLNGQEVDDQYWDGQIKFFHRIEGPQSLLLNGPNQIEVEYVGDTGAIVDTVYLNYIEITYLATLLTTQDVLKFTPGRSGRFTFDVAGFSTDQIEVFDITDPLAVRHLENIDIVQDGSSYSAEFEDFVSTTSTYLVIGQTEIMDCPVPEADRPSSLMLTDNHADYIIISHRDFIGAAELIAEHHRAKGEAVFVADVEDVYDEFNFGIKDPAAIRDFLSYAYHNWAGPPPSDVLLVGDANIDYKNRVSKTIDYLPMHLELTREVGQTPSDNWFVCVDGDDILPDMAIGRVCAKKEDDVLAVYRKIVSYDNGGASGQWLYNVLFVAGDNTSESTNHGLDMSYLPIDYKAEHIDIPQYASGKDAKPDIISAINNGCLIVNYAGHGNINRWALGSFSSADIASLSNAQMLPLVITLTCLNGYFTDWTTECLGELFVNTATNGSIASWSPTGADDPSYHRILAQELFEGLFYDYDCYLGSVTTAAKIRGYARGGYYFNDIVKTFELFGDPGLRLAVPTAPSWPTLTIETDRDAYYAGYTVNADATLENLGEPMRVDAYLALGVGETVLFYPNWGTEPTPIALDLPAFLRMRLRAVSLLVPDPPPRGEYAFFGALTEPGDISAIIGQISVATFQVR